MNILDYRNAKRIKDNVYDVEIETIEFGWIPTTIITDAVETDLDHMVQLNQWIIDNPGLIADERPTSTEQFNQLVDEKYSEIINEFTTAITALKANTNQDEINSWGKQETEARAYTADNNANVPLLDNIAASRGITVADLASKIIVKSDAYAIQYGTALGIKQSKEDQIQNIIDSADDIATKTTNLNNV